MKRAAILLAVLLAAPAWAADQWNAGTLTGTGRTEALSYPATCSSSIALAIPRRGTSLTNALTKYVVSASGITATAATPSAPTLMEKILGVGCDGSTALVSGSGIWLQSSTLSSLSSWTSQSAASATLNAYAGTITKTGTGGRAWQMMNVFSGGSSARLFNFDISSFGTGDLAGSSPLPSGVEIVGTSVSSSYYFSAAANTGDGRPYFRGYASGTSYAFTAQAGSTMQSSSEYWYPPYGLNGTLGVATQYSPFYSSTTRAAFVTSAGTITIISVGAFDAIPLGDWDPTGSLRRGWFIRKSNGAAYSTDSASAPTAISAASTYDIPSGALGGSTPLFAIMELDLDLDGTTSDNALVMMADGLHFAAFGECVDADGDGYPGADSIFCSTHTEDCNDASSAINPGATEIPNDGIDQDCSGADTVRSATRTTTINRGLGSTLGGTL